MWQQPSILEVNVVFIYLRNCIYNLGNCIAKMCKILKYEVGTRITKYQQ